MTELRAALAARNGQRTLVALTWVSSGHVLVYKDWVNGEVGYFDPQKFGPEGMSESEFFARLQTVWLLGKPLKP
jgi:hypothetical protein